MIGAKHMDPVMGVDIHIIMIPTPAGPVPTPIPHPFIGMVIDPMDYVPIIGATVIVNGMPVGVAGTGAKNIPPHIPMGGPFGPPPPGNEGEIFMGSATVLADGEPFSYTGLPVLSCNAFGTPAPPRAKKGGAKSLMLPTSVVLSVPMGMPVMVGGPPTISMMGMAMKFGMAALGKLAKKFRKMQKSSDKWGELSDALKRKADDVLKNASEGVRNKVRKAICFVTGHPVDIPTGKVFTDKIDFELPGPIPLVWERTWYSTSQHSGPMGHGWHHNYDWAIIPQEWEGQLQVRMGDGRYVIFPTIEVGESSYNRQDKLTLFRDEKGYYIRNERYEYYRFDENRGKEWPLLSISNDSGQQISFSYDEFGALTQIVDCCGRVLPIETDFFNRITTIRGPHPDREGETFVMMRYEYDGAGDLVKTWDALDHDAFYVYANHLLVQETDRNGLSFYFEYDGLDHNAKCVHTWGDGGIYDHKLTYIEGITYVENSLGHTKTYHHNGALVTEEIDAKGNSTFYEYNEYYETLAEVDALGRRAEYQYDKWGNRINMTFPDGSLIRMVYEEHALIQVTDKVGGIWSWNYNMAKQLAYRQDCMGATHSYQYDAAGKLQTITYPNGEQVSLLFDNRLNLVQLTAPNNATNRWKFDHLGRNRGSIDARGNVQRRHFDLLGNIVRVDEAGGNHRYLKYDPEGNLIHVKDRDQEVQFTFQGIGRIRSRLENGTEVNFLYDTEENLIGIRNEKDELYSFDLDENGQLELESGFDGIKRYFKRDVAGRVKTVLRASGIETRYEYDELDRVTKVAHFEDLREVSSERYSYREDGEMLEAENSHSRVKFEKDLLGRIVKEWEGDHWIESSYDDVGFRHNLNSSSGAQLDFQRNGMGDIESVSTYLPNGRWEARFKRDIFGLETRRSFNGGVFATWERDQVGRPTTQQIFAGGGIGKALKTRKYVWDVKNRITSLQIDDKKVTQFGHDEFGNLAWASYENDQRENRMPDEIGNLFKKIDRSDRKYGPAGQLLESDGITYKYDPEGNLIVKTEANGSYWIYEWNPNGMLSKVKRPDGNWVSFSYDPLGRRLSKTFDGKTTRWIWDGDVPLHEWISEETELIAATHSELEISFHEKSSQVNSLIEFGEEILPEESESIKEQTKFPKSDVITWVFEPGTFAPIAKLVEGKAYPVITDHLGTPVAMFDETGDTIWKAETSIFGELRNLEGDRSAMPFRYPGQYEDPETGLYYNRFRYYDSKDGQYISQDPIRLKGGMPTFYAYVPNPNLATDALGLSITSWNQFQEDFAGTFNNDNQMPWNTPPNNSADAAEGWDWYKQNNKTTDTPVLGRLDDTSPYKSRSGYQVLDSDRWSPGVNKAWVQGGIDRGASFKLVSPRTPENLIVQSGSRIGKPTVFADELDMLKKAGYVEKNGYMVPGSKCK